VSTPYRLVVFDALTLRALVVNDNQVFPEELAAFRTAFRSRQFSILITDGVLDQYLIESTKPPRFNPQQILDNLRNNGRAIRFDENRLNRFPVQLLGLPQEHSEFILDALAAQASYCITHRQEWLNLSGQTEKYGLQIVSPTRFVQLEGN
jgi:hypothetical protein